MFECPQLTAVVFRGSLVLSSHLCLQEAAEGSLLLDVLAPERHGHAQNHDHHHEEAADHPRSDQGSSGGERRWMSPSRKEDSNIRATKHAGGVGGIFPTPAVSCADPSLSSY